MSLTSIRNRSNDSLIPEYSKASELIQVKRYSKENKIFEMADGTIGVGFICSPLSGCDSKVQDRFNGFLNQEFPEGTMLTFNLFRSPDIKNKLSQYRSIRDHIKEPFYRSVVDSRANFLDYHSMNKIISFCTKRSRYDLGKIHDVKLFVTCKIPISHSSGSVTEREIENLVEIRNKVESSLKSVHLNPSTLDAREYIRALNSMLNWGGESNWRKSPTEFDETETINKQLFDYTSSVDVKKDHIKIGKAYIKTLSAKTFPSEMWFGNALAFAGDLSGSGSSLKENYMITTNIYYPNHEKEKGKLVRKRQLTINQAHGRLVKFVPVLEDKKRGFDVLYKSMTNGFKPINISYTMTIFSPTLERAESAEQSAENMWSEQKIKLKLDKMIMLPIFINSLPFGADKEAKQNLMRYKTMTTEQVAPLIPIFGEWKGTGTYHVALVSRNGQLMSLSLHDSQTNKNVVIAAESGSGKSFLANEIIIAYLSEGAIVWVIDAGKSYKKLCNTLNGDFIMFDENSTVCLNPFELIIKEVPVKLKDWIIRTTNKNNARPSEQEIQEVEDKLYYSAYSDEEDTVVGIVRAMASAKGNLDDFQIAGLKQLMSGIWDEKKEKMTVDDIAEICNQQDDIRLRDLYTLLFPFTSRGTYGKYFVGKNNMKFTRDFTVLELDELQKKKHLRQVVLLQLIYQIQQEVFLGSRNRKKLVFVDEAWDLLKEGEVAQFMEAAYRKFRKYGGSVAICTQSVNDLYENAVGQAIAENSASMYLLGQTEETVESIKKKKRLSLPESGFDLLKSVHTILGVYSEIFIKSKSGIGVGRLIVGDLQKLLYSTDPEDISAIDKFERRGMSTIDAINSVIEEREAHL